MSVRGWPLSLALVLAVPVMAGCRGSQGSPGSEVSRSPNASDDTRAQQVSGLVALATGAYASAGPQALYDYLSYAILGHCTREGVAAALAGQETPRGLRTVTDIRFQSSNQATANAVYITDEGDKDVAWSLIMEDGSWRISDLPGLSGCRS